MGYAIIWSILHNMPINIQTKKIISWENRGPFTSLVFKHRFIDKCLLKIGRCSHGVHYFQVAVNTGLTIRHVKTYLQYCGSPRNSRYTIKLKKHTPDSGAVTSTPVWTLRPNKSHMTYSTEQQHSNPTVKVHFQSIPVNFHPIS